MSSETNASKIICVFFCHVAWRNRCASNCTERAESRFSAFSICFIGQWTYQEELHAGNNMQAHLYLSTCVTFVICVVHNMPPTAISIVGLTKKAFDNTTPPTREKCRLCIHVCSARRAYEMSTRSVSHRASECCAFRFRFCVTHRMIVYPGFVCFLLISRHGFLHYKSCFFSGDIWDVLWGLSRFALYQAFCQLSSVGPTALSVDAHCSCSFSSPLFCRHLPDGSFEDWHLNELIVE